MSWQSGVSVLGPDSRRWVVRRRWMPRLGPETLWGRFRRRSRGARRRAGDFADIPDPGCGVDVAEGIVVFLVVIVVVLLAVFVVIPLLVAIVDLLILLLLALLALVFRVVFRRPWIVEAAHAEAPVERALRWKVVGWRTSAERCREIADALQAGVVPPDGEEVAIGQKGGEEPPPDEPGSRH